MIAALVGFWTQSWIGGDAAAARRLIAPDAAVEWNLAAPVDDEEVIQLLDRIAAFADHVAVVSRTVAGPRAALVYDCAAPFGTARTAEFLTVRHGRITELRQLHDAVALDRYFPGLLDG
jgi:hypothetical protein